MHLYLSRDQRAAQNCGGQSPGDRAWNGVLWEANKRFVKAFAASDKARTSLGAAILVSTTPNILDHSSTCCSQRSWCCSPSVLYCEVLERRQVQAIVACWHTRSDRTRALLWEGNASRSNLPCLGGRENRVKTDRQTDRDGQTDRDRQTDRHEIFRTHTSTETRPQPGECVATWCSHCCPECADNRVYLWTRQCAEAAEVP